MASIGLAVTAGWIFSLALFAFLVAFCGAALSPAIQTRLMDVAEDNQSIAAALNHSALNMGNSLGALLGGLVIAAGLGLVAPAWVGAALALAGLVVAVVAYRVEDRSGRHPAHRMLAAEAATTAITGSIPTQG